MKRIIPYTTFENTLKHGKIAETRKCRNHEPVYVERPKKTRPAKSNPEILVNGL